MISARLVPARSERPRDRKRKRVLLRVGARTWRLTRAEAFRLYRGLEVCLWRLEKEAGR